MNMVQRDELKHPRARYCKQKLPESEDTRVWLELMFPPLFQARILFPTNKYCIASFQCFQHSNSLAQENTSMSIVIH